ncbi:helix-turn-helix domain-containing protein [Spirosoma linguale]
MKTRVVKIVYANKLNTIVEISQLFRISRATVYRYLAWKE